MGFRPEDIDQTAGEAMIHAVYPYAWAIVPNSSYGEKGKELGSGIALRWRNHFMLVTAAHVVAQTPEEDLLFFPPAEQAHIAEKFDLSDPRLELRPRRQLIEPRRSLLYGPDDLDLAAIPLPIQSSLLAETNFYQLSDDTKSPALGTNVTLLGHPGDIKLTVGQNFAATPYAGFGEISSGEGCPHDPETDLAVSYKAELTVSPKGMSGSGIWYSQSAAVEGHIWSPRVVLGAMVTDYCAESETLIGIRVEALIEFLKGMEDQIDP